MGIKENEQLENLIARLTLLHDISQEISEKKPLDELLDEIIDHSNAVMRAEATSLLLYEEDNNMLKFHYAKGGKDKYIQSKYLEMGQGIAGWVAENKKSLLIEDCYNDERFNREIDKESGFKTKSMICVPLLKKDKLIGVMQVMNALEREYFDESDLQICETLATQCAIAIDNARLSEIQIEAAIIENELETARRIHEKIIPSILPEFDDIEIEVNLIPAKKIGGDYYNIIKIDEDKTLFLVTDVSGKSISAALIVSAIHTFLKTYLIINDSQFNLTEFVKTLNTFLIESTTLDKFATGWFGLYYHNSRHMESINAGHNPIYLFTDEGKRELLKGGLFLGTLETDFEVENIALKKNDLIVFYTDGVTEAWDSNEEEYGEERLLSVIIDNMNDPTIKLLKKIRDNISEFIGDASQSDDLTLGIIRIL